MWGFATALRTVSTSHCWYVGKSGLDQNRGASHRTCEKITAVFFDGSSPNEPMTSAGGTGLVSAWVQETRYQSPEAYPSDTSRASRSLFVADHSLSRRLDQDEGESDAGCSSMFALE